MASLDGYTTKSDAPAKPAPAAADSTATATTATAKKPDESHDTKPGDKPPEHTTEQHPAEEPFSWSSVTEGVGGFFGKIFKTSEVTSANLAADGTLPKLGVDGKPDAKTDGKTDAADPNAAKPDDKGVVSKAWDWLSSDATWSKWFTKDASATAGDAAKKTDFKNADGTSSAVAVGDKGADVNIKDKNGNEVTKAHVDGHTITDSNGKGTDFQKDKDSGIMGEKGPHGESWQRMPNGDQVLNDGQGHSLIRRGDEFFTKDKDGTEVHVDAKEARTVWQNGHKAVLQHSDGSQNNGEAGTVQSGRKADGTAATQVNSNDGQTHLETDAEGHKVLKVGEGRNQIEIEFDPKAKDKSEFTVETEHGTKEYKLHQLPNGQWEALDRDGKPSKEVQFDGKTINLGGDKRVTVDDHGNLIIEHNGTTTKMNADGSAQVTDQGGTTRVAANSDQVTVQNGDGKGGNVKLTATGDQSTLDKPNGEQQRVHCHHPGQDSPDDGKVETTKVINGKTVTDVIDPKHGTAIFNTPDGPITLGRDDQGRSTMTSWSGTQVDGGGNVELFDHTRIDNWNNIDFTDGTHIDSAGNVSHNGDSLGKAGGSGWSSGGNSPQADSAVGQATAAISAASADIQTLLGQIHAGYKVDPGALTARYSDLGAQVGSLQMAGAQGAVGAVLSAQAEVAGAISQASVQVQLIDLANQVVSGLRSEGFDKQVTADVAVELFKSAHTPTAGGVTDVLTGGQAPPGQRTDN